MNVPRAALELNALVVHARAVSSDDREAFAQAAMRVAHDPRVILLRTCHRVELYHVDVASPHLPALTPPTPPIGGERLEGLGERAEGKGIVRCLDGGEDWFDGGLGLCV